MPSGTPNMTGYSIPSFILPANGKATPEAVARKRRLAEAMMGQGIDTSPVESPWQAVARVAQAGIGGYSDYQAGQQEEAGRSAANEEMVKLLSGNPDNAAIMGAMNNPWITDTQGRMASALMEENFRKARPPALTDDMQEYQYGQQDPAFIDYMMNMKKAGASQTNIDMKGQTEYSKERGKGRAESANTVEKEERAAMQSITSLGAMENAMNDPNFYSGFMADGVNAAKKLAVAMGGDPNQVAATETFNSFAKQAALASMGGSLGTGFSNADRDFVMGQVPTTDNTPEGNKRLIQIHRKIAQRKIQIARMMREYENINGQLDNGFLDQLAQWAEANPMFPQQPQQTQQQPPMTQFDLMTQPQQQQQPSTDNRPAPPGVDPKLWELMPPEDRALWR